MSLRARFSISGHMTAISFAHDAFIDGLAGAALHLHVEGSLEPDEMFVARDADMDAHP